MECWSNEITRQLMLQYFTAPLLHALIRDTLQRFNASTLQRFNAYETA